jgi:hypothetical protein
MLFSRINRSNPEKIFIVAKQSYATAAASNGQAYMWDYATDADGVGVTLAAAGTGRAGHYGTAFAGIAAETIAAGAYGLFQVYGYHSAVRVRSNTGGNPAIAAGTGLTMKSAVFCLESAPPNDGGATSTVTVSNYHWVGFALAAQASWTTKAIACFLKGL